MTRNEKTRTEDRLRERNESCMTAPDLMRKAAGLLFAAAVVLTPAALSGCGALPGAAGQGASGARGTGTQAAGTEAGQASGEENASEGTASDAETSVEKASLLPYYGEDGIFIWDADTGKTKFITDLMDDPFDPYAIFTDMGNPADSVRLSPGGNTVYFMKNYGVTPAMRGTANLFAADLSMPDGKRKDVPIAEAVVKYEVMENGRLIVLDSEGRLSEITASVRKGAEEKKRLGSYVNEFYTDSEGKRIFFRTVDEAGFAYNTGTGQKKKVATGVTEIIFSSEDLDTIYYVNEANGRDLFVVKDLDHTDIIDVDIEDLVVLERTGSIYYLRGSGEQKEEEEIDWRQLLTGGTGTGGDESGTAEFSGDGPGEESEDNEGGPGAEDADNEGGPGAESAEDGGDPGTESAEDGEYLGEWESATDTEYLGEWESPLEEDDQEEDDQEESGRGLAEMFGSSGEKAGPGEEEPGDVSSGKEPTMTLGYYNGKERKVIGDGYIVLGHMDAENILVDRIIAERSGAEDHAAYLIREDKAFDTGLSVMDPKKVQFLLDREEDIFYYIERDPEDEDSGTFDKGDLYRMDYSEKGFSDEPAKLLYSNAYSLQAAESGVTYYVNYRAGEVAQGVFGGILYIDGEEIDDHVEMFFWSSEDPKGKVDYLCDRFEDTYAKSAAFIARSEDGTKRGIAYGVRDCMNYGDGNYAFITDFDEEEGRGSLIFWDGDGDPVRIADRVTGVVTGDE